MNTEPIQNKIKQSGGITVVIPVYNRAEMVKATLSSVAKQTYRPMKVVLVDNNSTDATLDTLKEWAESVKATDFEVRIETEMHPTAAAARQKGAESADTEYIMFFDSDDIMHPNHVARTMEAFFANTTADVIGWDYPVIDKSGRHLHTCHFRSKDLIWGGLMNGSFSTLRYAMRTSLLHMAGGWDIRVTGWDDMELGVRIALLKPKTIKLKGRHSITVVSHAETITGKAFSDSPSKWEETMDIIDNEMPTRRYRRMALLKRAILAGHYRHEGASDLSRQQMAIVSERERCPFYRAIYHAAMHWVGRGLPGVSYIFRPFF